MADLELSRLTSDSPEIKDEAAVRVASKVYVWDGTKGVFLNPNLFLEMKKRYPCESKDMEGVMVAILTEHVKNPDWSAVLQHRKDDTPGQLAYHEKVVLFQRHDKGIARAYLMTYYGRGKFVDELLKEPKKYGNHTVKNFATDLGVEPASVYLYQRFASLYQDRRVLELSDKDMSWTVVTQLLSLHSEKERTRIENAYLAGKLKVGQVKEEIKKAKRAEAARKPASGEKRDRRGGPGLSRLFDGTKELSTGFQEKLSEFSEGRKAYHKLPEDSRKKELKGHLKAAEVSLVQAYKRLSKVVGDEHPRKAGAESTGEIKKEE